jgi:hypothetical protein
MSAKTRTTGRAGTSVSSRLVQDHLHLLLWVAACMAAWAVFALVREAIL